MNKLQISYLQQALWKLQAAQNLINLAFGRTDVGQMYDKDIEALLQDIEADMAELHDPIDK